MIAVPATRAKLALGRIAIIDRLRPIDEDWVAVLMSSMDDRGQDVPIIVRPMPPVKGADHALVAGLHRLTAAERLGWSEIDVDIRPLDDDAARLAEIDENLMRRELSALDRGVFMRERKLVWDRLHPDAAKPGPKAGGSVADRSSQPLRQFAQRFTADAAERTGFSERSIQLAVTVGRLPAEVRDVLRGTPIEHSTTKLVQLVAEEGDNQIAVARLLAAGEAKTIADAKARLGLTAPKPAREPDPEAPYKLLTNAWVTADAETQRRFIRMLRKTGVL